MKYNGIKEVKCVVYPNNYIVVAKSNKVLSYIIINLAICLGVCATILISKYIGGTAQEIVETVSERITSSGLV